jgi:hypothetical protein
VQQPAQPVAPPMQTAAAANAQPADPEPASAPQPADDPDTVDERAVVDPPLPLDDAPASAAESAPAGEPAPAASLPEPDTAVAATPVETPAAPVETAPAAPAPVAESPTEPATAPEVEQVGSIPAADSAETPQPAKAKRKRAARKAAARRPIHRAFAPASTGYPLLNTTSSANRPAWGFWTTD